MTHPRRRPRAAAAAVALTALAASAAAPAAAHAAASGATTIQLGGTVARSLRAQGVTIAARKPAKATRTRITLPVAAGSVGTAATLDHRGSVSFRTRTGRRTRVATFTAWQTKLAPKRSTISAKLGRRRVPLFTLTFPKGARASQADTVALRTSTVRLTPKGARTLRRSLGLTTLPAGVLGKARVAATVDNGGGSTPTTPGTGGGGTGGGGTGGGGGGTTPAPTPGSPRCQGFASGDVPVASAPLARTDRAADVTASTFWWRPKDSWIRYINTGYEPGDGVFATDGATPGAPEGTPSLVYRFGFSLAAGSWYDARTAKGVLYFKGTVRFKWNAHGLDITTSDPEVQIDGAAPRLVFKFTGSECSTLRAQRVDFARLAFGAPTGTYDYGSAAATITAAGSSAFSSMYLPDSEWGSIDLSLTTG